MERDTMSCFYLKINTCTEFSMHCFWNWYKIVEFLNADYFVVVDNENIKIIIENLFLSNDRPVPKFISSDRQHFAKLIEGIEPYFKTTRNWINIGAALYTPFVHAKENGYEYFWNIDADDTVMLAEVSTVASLLKEAECYGIENKTDVFSLDMYYSSLGNKYWTFGVAFCNLTNVDFDSCFLKGKAAIISEIKSGTRFAGRKDWLDIDKCFEILSDNNIIDCKAFSCDGLWFRHAYQSVQTWKNKEIIYHRMSVWTTRSISEWEKLKRDAEEKGTPFPPISDKLIKLNKTQFTPETSSLDFEKKILTAPLKYNSYKISVVEKQALSSCEVFDTYVFSLFSQMDDLLIIISTFDNHTTRGLDNRSLRALKMLGIRSDLEKTFGYSFIAVIDGGKCVKELIEKDKRIETDYELMAGAENLHFKISSQGYNTAKTSHCNISVEMNGVDLAANRRGLNFLVFDKKSNSIIDSAAFDTFGETMSFNFPYRDRAISYLNTPNDFNKCNHLSLYVLGLKKFNKDLTVCICGCDAYTNINKTNSSILKSLKLLGLNCDMNETYRYSYIGILDGGLVVAELLSKDQKLSYSCDIDGNKIDIESVGYNAVRERSKTLSKININNENFAVNKRGLNIVVWDKKNNRLIDSVCFDTFLDGKAVR